MARSADGGIAVALTVAGSDSGGGAGIQADLKAFAALEVHGTSAITCVTAQSTTEVRSVYALPPSEVRAQIECVRDDFRVGAAKTGMLHDAGIIEAVADSFARAPLPLIVDPVMVSTSGYVLLRSDAIACLVSRLFPLAELVTPNLDEVQVLTGTRPSQISEMVEAGRALLARGAHAVLVKGGHLEGDPADVFVASSGASRVFSVARIETQATHGTGCTLSAAIAAERARGVPLEVAIEAAQRFVHQAILAASEAPALGRGSGPLHPFARFYRL